ncbi:MAG TPA: TPM domain-containing protein, partial [Gemmatimonadaceae bacterium]|nr:TPM domain-containing protein [Gemmatimonadaceae bacterium]
MRHRALQAIGALIALQPIQLPPPRGYVNDFAGVIPAESQAQIQRIIDDVRAKSGGEIVVVTLPSIGQQNEADVARQIGRAWKVGRAGKPGDPARNTGVIILIVPKESSADGRGHVRIETGYGAEGFITDGTAGEIRDEAIPLLRQRDYGGATELMTRRVAERFGDEFHFTLDSTLAPAPVVRYPRSAPSPGIPGPLLFVLFLILFLIFVSAASRGRRGCGGCLPIFIPVGRGGWGGGGGSWGG